MLVEGSGCCGPDLKDFWTFGANHCGGFRVQSPDQTSSRNPVARNLARRDA